MSQTTMIAMLEEAEDVLRRVGCDMTAANIRKVLQAQQAEPVALSAEWTPCVKLPVTVHVREQRQGETHVSTREGITPILPSDLIMRGVMGEEYPIGRELFERTYRLGEADAQPPAVTDRDAIRRIFMAHGFTIKDGQTDLKPYVYEAAEALLRELSPAVAVPDDLFQTAENAAACSHNFATAKQARSPNCIAQDRCKQMLELANEITASASPEEDELLEVAYAIARYLKLDWPSAYDVDYAFKRIDEALTGMAITVEEEQAFEHLRAMLAAAEQGADPIKRLIAMHNELLGEYPYCYFELAYTRRTDWMAWLCTKPREDDPERKVLACGQGLTAEEACAEAISAAQKGGAA